MKVSELKAIIDQCDGDEECRILHAGRESPLIDAKVMGFCQAVVEEGGVVCISDEMRASSTFELCLFGEDWDRVI